MSQLSQNSENDSSEDSEVENHLEKIHFTDLVKDTKSVAGFCPSHQFQLLLAEQGSQLVQLELSHLRTHRGHVTRPSSSQNADFVDISMERAYLPQV